VRVTVVDPPRLSREDLKRSNGVKGMRKLEIRVTGVGHVAIAAIAALTLHTGACKADELGPSCKQYLQLKQQCLAARANTISIGIRAHFNSVLSYGDA